MSMIFTAEDFANLPAAPQNALVTYKGVDEWSGEPIEFRATATRTPNIVRVSYVDDCADRWTVYFSLDGKPLTFDRDQLAHREPKP